jgi:hypothetical protein
MVLQRRGNVTAETRQGGGGGKPLILLSGIGFLLCLLLSFTQYFTKKKGQKENRPA